VVAIDDEDAVAQLGLVDTVADTVGGAVATRLIARVRPGGTYGYASVIPEGTQAINPTVTITRVYAKPDPSKVREFADDVRDGKFILPIGRRMPLADAAEAHNLGASGGAGKIVLFMP
jgi:NADPH:quinone reductase-like Zn-dependent oxidoreductase